MRVVLYARVSTIDKDQNPDIQVQFLRTYCAQRQWTVVKEIVEFVSATDKERPGLEEMAQMINAGDVDAVMVTKLDRLFRSAVDMLGAVKEWEALGVKFVAAEQNVDPTTAMGKAFLGMLAIFAEFELNMIRERTRAGLAYRKQHGPRPGKKAIGRPRRVSSAVVKSLYSKGHTIDEIRARFKCGIATIHRALNRKDD